MCESHHLLADVIRVEGPKKSKDHSRAHVRSELCPEAHGLPGTHRGMPSKYKTQMSPRLWGTTNPRSE